MLKLNEDKRNQLLSQSKPAQKEKDGKNRFQKRVKCKLKPSVQQLNRLNFNQLFKDNIMTVILEVQGETNKYDVTISFGGFLDQIKKQLEKANNQFSLRIVIRALIDSFNSDNVYYRCNCPDFQYRFGFWLSKENIIIGEKENRPSNITNPDNKLGKGCKHIMLVISNTSWIIKLASVVTNYVNYMKLHYKKMYADIIYPAIYGEKYQEPIQLDIDTIDKYELDTSTNIIDKSNIEAKDRGKFKQGNKIGVRFAPKQNNTTNNLIQNNNDDINDEEDLQ